ncbi:uncharacterized protein LOC143290825 [Babylonia areolata]|uniref:uncharacterized protein LOC143290825 n=1 Tax=Babylonia areolata TaxID=304850 RepID=UPI003FCF6F61
MILNRTVTCGGGTWGVFSARTYTCDDIKVDGLRLAYGYYPGMEVSDKRCQETEGRQELTRLCKHLLKYVEKRHKGFYGVFVNNATCGYSEKQRLMFIKNTRRSHKWVNLGPGYGWLSSISCMVRS